MSDNLKELREAIEEKLVHIKRENIFLLSALGSYLAALRQHGDLDKELDSLMRQCGVVFGNFRIELESILQQVDQLEEVRKDGKKSDRD